MSKNQIFVPEFYHPTSFCHPIVPPYHIIRSLLIRSRLLQLADTVPGQLKTPHSTTTPLSHAVGNSQVPRGGDEQREDTRGEEAGGCRRALSDAGEGPAEDAGERGGREAFRG